MSRYVINVLASRDLNEIADYFAQTNLEAGERFFREFNRKCQQLTAFPNSGKSYAEIPTDLISDFTYLIKNNSRSPVTAHALAADLDG